MHLLDTIRSLFQPSYKPLNYITINAQAIEKNIRYLSQNTTLANIFPVIKSNAYGHSIEKICQIYNNIWIQTVCIDSIYEYQRAKKYFKGNMILLWETHHQNYPHLNEKRVAIWVYNLSTLEFLAGTNKKYNIHLFLNTGMNREGIQESDIPKACEILWSSHLVLQGVVSHFSCADDISNDYTYYQIKKFKDLYSSIEANDFHPIYRYMSASGWLLKVDDDFFTANKPWFSCYGYNPLLPSDPKYKNWEWLQPALDVYSTVTSIQTVFHKNREWVGYNATYKPKIDTRLASIPFGYNEWLDRRLSNNWEVKIWKKYYQLRGRVSMNFITVEIGQENISIWDRVHIMSSQVSDRHNIYEMAERLGTIPYEILVKYNPTVKRIIQ